MDTDTVKRTASGLDNGTRIGKFFRVRYGIKSVLAPVTSADASKPQTHGLLAQTVHIPAARGLRLFAWFVPALSGEIMHEAMAATLDTVVTDIKQIQRDARNNGAKERPRWPMIVLNSPKGWTGPKVVDGKQIENTFRAHQVPISDPRAHPEHLALIEAWLKSYRPAELFDAQGRLLPELAELAPKDNRRMGANPHANGGLLLQDLDMPDFRDYAIDVPKPGVRGIGDTHVLGRFLRDVVKRRTVSSETSAFSAPMRRCPMGWKRCLKSLYVNGTQPLPQLTSFSRPPGG